MKEIIKFEDFKEKNIKLLDFLNSLGFIFSNYSDDGTAIYWHFEYKNCEHHDILKYYEDIGIIIFSTPKNFYTETNKIDTIISALDLFLRLIYYCKTKKNVF